MRPYGLYPRFWVPRPSNMVLNKGTWGTKPRVTNIKGTNLKYLTIRPTWVYVGEIAHWEIPSGFRVWGAPSNTLPHGKLSAEPVDQGTYGELGTQQEPKPSDNRSLHRIFPRKCPSALPHDSPVSASLKPRYPL